MTQDPTILNINYLNGETIPKKVLLIKTMKISKKLEL